MPRPRSLLLLVLLFGLAAPFIKAVEKIPEAEDEAWRAMRERRFTETIPPFDAALRAAPRSSALAAGRAVALLNQQPRTRQNVADADQILATLAAEPDDIGLAARYLRARVADVHLFEPDAKLAAQRYVELIAAAPAHPIAQAAVAKLVMLHVYRLGEDPVQALAAAEAWAGQLSDPAARRDYHHVMARSYLFFRVSPELALDHLQKTDEAGVLAPTRAAAVLVGIAELARELGHKDVARAAYEEFLKTYLRDQRVYMIRQRLAELDAEQPSATPATATP